MAYTSRSAVLAIVKEDTEGTLKDPSSGSAFTALRQGYSFAGGVDTVTSDELVDDIGASEGFVTKESPTMSLPKYFKHSGTEGQAPDYSVLLESAMGEVEVASTEYDTVAGSTAGTSAARASLNVDTGEGANFEKGQAVLIKDPTNGYRIRNIYEVVTDALKLNFNLPAAPTSGVNLGKAVHYKPKASGHPSFSAHLYQASSALSAFKQAIAGCRTTNTSIEFPVNQLATLSFDAAGIQFYWNQIRIDATNNKIDFTDSSGTVAATLTSKVYKTPIDLALEVSNQMTGASLASASDTITCTYDSKTGKFTIESDGSVLSLLWQSGSNTAVSAGTTLGFAVAADDTSALTYTSDNEQDYSAPYTPSPDTSSPNVVKHNELVIGGFDRYECRSSNNASFTIATPKTDVEDICAESGVSESVTLERTFTFSATLILKKHEAEDFYNFINNNTTSIMFNHGTKEGGNWVPGTCVNVYSPNAKITGYTVSEAGGLLVVNVEGSGFVNSAQKDVHINLL